MIRSIDVRIGNWYAQPGEGFKQIQSGNEIDNIETSGAEPIPITEELLLAMGFVKRGTTEIYDMKANNFAYHLGVQRVTIFHPGNHYWHWLGTHILFVHQIQNLFYCIVGHDLSL